MTTVQLEEIEKSVGGRPLITGLDLAIGAGEYVVLVGPSGSGKTTLLKLIAGLLRADAGRIRIGGNDVTTMPPRLRPIAMLFQHDALYPHLRVRDSMAFGLGRGERNNAAGEGEGVGGRAARINQAAELCRATALLDRYPAQLSGGELRRAALSKAIARGATIRLLDEPLSALDPSARFLLQDDLARLHQAEPGITLHVTHDGQEALRLADSIAVLHDGKIVQHADPQTLYNDPDCLSAALALGSPPINVMPVSVIPVSTAGVAQALPSGEDLQIDSNADDTGGTTGVSRRRLCLAFRPEAAATISVTATDPPLAVDTESGALQLAGTVQRCLLVGANRYGCLTVGDQSIQFSLAGDHMPGPGEHCGLIVARPSLLWFDRVTQRRLR